MNKTVFAVIAAVLIAVGGFFYWGATSDTVDNKQQEVSDTITKPLTDSKTAGALQDDRMNEDYEKMNEALGEEG